ncbi:MAG: succinate dehydrogenase assembly factor 2 [Alphaproteobacteria bacterium]
MKIYLKKLLFKASHRGTKEMDIILGNYAANSLEKMSVNELNLFEELLELPDPDIYKWITNKSKHEIPKKFKDLITDISRM